MVKKKRIGIFAIILLIFMLAFVSTILSCGNDASAYIASNSPTSIGELTVGGYASRTDGLVFSQGMLKTLYSRIAGTNATYTTVYDKVSGLSSAIKGKNEVMNTQSKSMNFQQITSANSNNPLTVTLGGIKWSVVYLTTNTYAGSNGASAGDLIATLFMCDNKGSAQWNGYSSATVTAGTGNYASHNYGTSKVRISTLNAGSTAKVDTQFATGLKAFGGTDGTVKAANRVTNDYAIYTMSNDALAGSSKAGASLVNFLATPSQVRYQEYESFYWAYNANFNADEAWGGTPTDGGSWSASASNANVPTQDHYYDWKNDYVWLPSMTETGFYVSGSQNCVSLWGINNVTLLTAAANYWTRSGFQQGAANAQYINANASGGNTTVNTSMGIRPALHLNLTLAEKNAYTYAEPQDITTPIYNGNSQTPLNMTTKPSWWNTDFEDSTKFKFEYFDNSETPQSVSEMKNAGEYWVKLSFATGNTNGSFSGSPSSDTAHPETNRERWFKFTINKKPIEVQFTASTTDGTFTVSAKNSADIAMSDLDRQPVFGVEYKRTDGYTVTDTPANPQKPDLVGDYTATAIITNASTCNFTIDTTKPYTASYSKGKTELKKPTVLLPTNPDTYKNDYYEYGVSDYDSTTMDISFDKPDASYDATSKRIKVRNAGTYEVTFVLKSSSEYCWDDKTILPVKYSITINQKEISVPNFNETLINSDAIKNAATARVPNAEIYDVCTSDMYPVVLVKFGFQDGAGNPFGFYPTSAGKYKAWLEIENADTSNYVLDATSSAKVVNFSVTGAVSLQASDLVWLATPNAGGDPITLVAPNYELPFIIGGYTISIGDTTVDKMLLRSKGVKIYTDTATSDNGYSGNINETNVSSSYVAEVRLINYDDSFTSYDKKFSINWKIAIHKVTTPSYTGGDITFSKDPTDLAELFGLPSDWEDYVDIEVKKYEEAFEGYEISDVGTYYVTMKIKPSMASNAIWDNNSPFAVNDSVKIIPRIVQITGWTSSAIPSAETAEAGDIDYLKYVYTKMDDTEVSYTDVIGTPNTTFKVQAVSKYGDNVIVTTPSSDVEDNKVFSTPGSELNPPTPIPQPMLVEDSKEYTGAELTFELMYFDSAKMVLEGTLSVTEIGHYSVTVRFRDGVNNCWEDGSRDPVTLEFSVTERTEPIPPEEPKEKEPNFFEKLIASHFPLWQIITMAVSVVLAVVFLIKAVQYGKLASKARGKAKKISERAYSALLPVFSTEVVLAGLSNQIWSIMAFASLGLALFMFFVALIMRSSWKKAEEAKETAMEDARDARVNAQNGVATAGAYGNANIEEILRKHDEERRREEEARRREDEERHRQEMDAMKMMFAGMMGRQQMDAMGFDYASVDDTDLLVQKVIAGLLPMVQQMVPEPTAYLSAPAESNEELLNIVEEQNAQMQAMSAHMSELQAQLDSMQGMADAIIMPDGDNSELLAKMEEMQRQIAELNSAPTSDGNNDELLAEMNALREQIKNLKKQSASVASDYENSDEMRAMANEVTALRQQVAMLSQNQFDMSIVDEEDEDIFDDEEEWDSILDEDEEDNFVESVIIEADGTVRKVSPNFRMRLKQSSDKNREWYAVIKNMFCSQKGVTYRVQKRVEKIRYQGQVIGVIGIAKRSIKLWLALKPYEYDARRYHHKDVSDKPRFVDVPMYVRVGSDRALERAQELILALFQDLNMEARKRYHDRDIQELIFTLKHNKLLNNKYNKTLLREIVHVHDCDVLDDETAEKCIESKNVDFVDNSVLETVKLDDIDSHFLDGNRVTLDKLKKVGLISEDCTGVNIVADKRLTKPLIIVANDFSLSAVKMIVLTGGRAIRLNQV